MYCMHTYGWWVDSQPFPLSMSFANTPIDILSMVDRFHICPCLWYLLVHIHTYIYTHIYIYTDYNTRNMVYIVFVDIHRLCGNKMVQSTWTFGWGYQVRPSCRYLGSWLSSCWTTHRSAIVSWWIRHWSALSYHQMFRWAGLHWEIFNWYSLQTTLPPMYLFTQGTNCKG